MTRTRARFLAGLCLVVALVSRLLVDAYRATGAVGPLVPWFAGVLPVALAVLLVVHGRRVRRLVNGDPTTLTPLTAARVAVLAQASSRVGAGVAGFYVGVLAVNLTGPPSPLHREQVPTSAVAAAGFVALAIAGWIVERWCRIPEDDDDRPGLADPEPA